jgi:hypothetical protein
VKTHIPFRFHLFSEVSVPSLSELTGIDFYRPSEIGPSLDDVGEIPILKWLVRRPDLMQLILGQLGFRGRVCLDVEVTKPFQPRHRAGDIDLLAVPERDPRLAVAFQAKRFKARLSDHGDDISLDGAKLDGSSAEFVGKVADRSPSHRRREKPVPPQDRTTQHLTY